MATVQLEPRASADTIPWVSWAITIVVSLVLLGFAGVGNGLINTISTGSVGILALPVIIPILVALALRFYAVTTAKGRGRGPGTRRRTAVSGGEGGDGGGPNNAGLLIGLLLLIALVVLLVVSPGTLGATQPHAGHMVIAIVLVAAFGLIFGFGHDKTMLKVWKLEFQGVQVGVVSWCAVFLILEKVAA